jgi:hypothetical protein
MIDPFSINNSSAKKLVAKIPMHASGMAGKRTK